MAVTTDPLSAAETAEAVRTGAVGALALAFADRHGPDCTFEVVGVDLDESALAAARALMDTDLDAEAIARKAMSIAAEICVYTNGNLTVEALPA